MPEINGLSWNLEESNPLRNKRYKPHAVKRIAASKKNYLPV
jgi:hypothetical protein